MKGRGATLHSYRPSKTPTFNTQKPFNESTTWKRGKIKRVNDNETVLINIMHTRVHLKTWWYTTSTWTTAFELFIMILIIIFTVLPSNFTNVVNRQFNFDIVVKAFRKQLKKCDSNLNDDFNWLIDWKMKI